MNKRKLDNLEAAESNKRPARSFITSDYLSTMLKQEADYMAMRSSLHKGLGHEAESEKAEVIAEEWRLTICEWCYSVADHFELDREVVSYAIEYLDRFAASIKRYRKITKKSYQLMATASLYLAVKLHSSKKLGISTFVTLSGGLFTPEVIESSERVLLQTLGWKLHPPTALGFLSHIFQVCIIPHGTEINQNKVITTLFDMSQYLTEVAVCASASFVHPKPSVVAVAAIMNAMETMDESFLPQYARHSFICKILDATNLCANDTNVLEAQELLDEICPHLQRFNPMRVHEATDQNPGANEKCTSTPVINVDICDQLANTSHTRRSPDCVSQIRPSPTDILPHSLEADFSTL